MTKSMYNTILKNKVLSPKSSSKWRNEFNKEPNWSCIAKWKLKHQTEVKIAEFNYKVLHKILSTNENLFKWQKNSLPQLHILH
jgi:hypothetical protein